MPSKTRYDEFLEMQAQETDECILWPYSQNGDGYGQVRAIGRKRHTHRLSCETAHGPALFTGAQAAHSCRNRHCFNPRHLRWATPAENEADKIADGTDNRGWGTPGAKLTEFDVRAIRHYVKCGTKQSVLASHYGVRHQTIYNVVTGRCWAWVS